MPLVPLAWDDQPLDPKPRLALLNGPDPDLTQFELIKQTVFGLDLDGECAWLVTSPQPGRVR